MTCFSHIISCPPISVWNGCTVLSLIGSKGKEANKINHSWVQWNKPIVSVTQETEARELLEQGF